MEITTDGFVQGYSRDELQRMTCKERYAEWHRITYIVSKTLKPRGHIRPVSHYINRIGEFADDDCKCDWCSNPDNYINYRCGNDKCDACNPPDGRD